MPASASTRPGLGMCWLLAVGLVVFQARALVAQVSQDQQAGLLLTSARKAYNEHNYPFANARFREFLQRFGGHKDAPGARFGLALAILDGTDKNYTEARDLLQQLAGNKASPDHPSVVYHLGLALRGLGLEELKLAAARPGEAVTRHNLARARFEEAARQFAAATVAFAGKAGAITPATKELPSSLEWAARARCDHAEMELRCGRPKECRQVTGLFLTDPVWAKSRYSNLARYYHGYASYLLEDMASAEKDLSLLAPFQDPVFGTHARYLLARTHHRSDEHAEAAVHYEGVLSDWAKGKQQAADALRKPDAAKLVPADRDRLQTAASGPPPDHVARAAFYLGVLRYEAGRFAEAQARFMDLLKLDPRSNLAAAARLRIGFCQVQQHEYPQALQTLQPLADREPDLADQAYFWIGKARLGAAPEPANLAGHEKALRDALESFRKAADRAGQHAGADRAARTRRGDALLAVADTLALLKQHKEAIQTYGQVLHEKLLPGRADEVTYRLITALHLAGEYNESDNAAGRFLSVYPKSPLLAAVLFRQAENSYFRSLAAEKGGRRDEANRLADETIRRYGEIVSRFPQFGQVNLARYGIAQAHYRKGELDKARQALESVPAADRTGELVAVNFLLADCLLRSAPTAAPEDALAAGKLDEQLKKAAELLDAFVASRANDPQAPGALLRLGLCLQRRATLLADKGERNKELQAARAVYDRLLQPQYASFAGQSQGVLERAKCVAELGDINGGINELRRFTADPLQKTPAAPVALVYLAMLLRGQNRAGEAADVLTRSRQQLEPELAKDPAKGTALGLLRYHHGVALREAGRLPEARAVLDLLLKQAPTVPEATEAALRFAQCLKDDGLRKLEAAAKRGAAGMANQQADAAKLRDEGLRDLQEAVKFLAERAAPLKGKDPPLEVRARMLYEIAWLWRELERADGGGKTDKVGPAEVQARASYRALIAEYPDLPLATEARFELAELFAQRKDEQEAIKLLTEGLDKEPAAELADKIRLRLGAAHAARGDLKAALGQLEAVAANAKGPLASQAQYRLGECFLQKKAWAEAVKRLVPFRDNPAYQNVPGLADRALLRLGHAYAHLGDWNESRRALEILTQRFGNSPWIHEARYGIAWSWQQQKNYEQAVGVYGQVTANTLTEVAAKAQLQIGLCRLEQKRFAEAGTALLVVPFSYDYPELSAVALLEASRAYREMNQPVQARRLLHRVIRDHPQTRWAQAAEERLAALKDG